MPRKLSNEVENFQKIVFTKVMSLKKLGDKMAISVPDNRDMMLLYRRMRSLNERTPALYYHCTFKGKVFTAQLIYTLNGGWFEGKRPTSIQGPERE